MILIHFLMYISFTMRKSKRSPVCLLYSLYSFLVKNCLFFSLWKIEVEPWQPRQRKSVFFSKRTRPGTPHKSPRFPMLQAQCSLALQKSLLCEHGAAKG